MEAVTEGVQFGFENVVDLFGFLKQDLDGQQALARVVMAAAAALRPGTSPVASWCVTRRTATGPC